MSFEEKYQDGEAYGDAKKASNNIFADPLKLAGDLLRDYAGVRSQASLQDLAGLIKELLNKGEPLDDKKGTTELLIGILCSLPSTSNARTQLTNKLIDQLWGTLQHPPLSYVGGDVKYEVVKSEESEHKHCKPYDTIEFKAPDSDITLREQVPQSPDGLYQYRMPDGSFNNILEPNLGRAGTPYAKSVRPTKRLHGVKPDPGLLFDLLMARDDKKFKENPAGISSMLFYHATIIIHDIFRTSRTDVNKSDTSSYLDLAPLYGSSLRDQLEIRTMKEGKLKPDTFHEKRLLGQPAGVNVMLVLYSRFHNYVADILLKINENGRFTLACGSNATPEERVKAVAKQDHDLFNTARLIVGGLYINISLHDYLRAITNTHSSNSDWTLDPRVEIDKQFDSEGVPRGVGNQVSVEFNLLYRFHACISKRDERWINDFFLKLFPGRNVDDLQNLSYQELGMALVEFEKSIPKDPSQRTFDGLKRQEDGTFRDEDLTRIMKESMDDPAGTFGARMVPKALRVVEILGITQGRKWQVASLNEFRQFFGLKRFETFKDINSDPDIYKILEKLYTDPDMVELYPGLMIEDFKPARSPGCGICPTYSVGRAILSDAVTLVRSDRFNTIDYTVANLTSWGYNEVQMDYKTLGGSMLYKLIQRGLPGWFPFNSVAVMQPMYTRPKNIEIAKKLGTIAQFSELDPKQPPKPVILSEDAAIQQVLGNPKQFVAPWVAQLNYLFPGQKDVSWFAQSSGETSKRPTIATVMGKVPNLHNAIHEFIERVGTQLIQKESFTLKEGLDQLDLIRDVAIPLNTQLIADLLYLDLRTDENPSGALSVADLYRDLLNIRTWGVNNNDPAQAWNRRRRAQEGANNIINSTRKIVQEVDHSRGIVGSWLHKTSIKKDSLRSCGHKIVEQLLVEGYTADQVVDNLWLTAFGGVGSPVTSFYEVMEFFLRPENATIWAEVQSLAQKNDDGALHTYVAEAQRLTTSQQEVRIVKQPTNVGGQSVKADDVVIIPVGDVRRKSSGDANASKFEPKSASTSVNTFTTGPHQYMVQEVSGAFVTGLVKLAADLKQLRPAVGQMGQVKTIMVGSTKTYLNDSWSYLGSDVSTWKVHFNGHGKGSFKGDQTTTKPMEMQKYYFMVQKRAAELSQ